MYIPLAAVRASHDALWYPDPELAHCWCCHQQCYMNLCGFDPAQRDNYNIFRQRRIFRQDLIPIMCNIVSQSLIFRQDLTPFFLACKKDINYLNSIRSWGAIIYSFSICPVILFILNCNSWLGSAFIVCNNHKYFV